MQTVIEELFEHVQERYEELFNIRKDWERVMNRFKYITFLGQVDKTVLYVSMLHQVINSRTGRIKNLTLAEADEYHMTGDITGLANFRPFAWTFWKIDMVTGYVSVFTSFKASERVSPKDNYAAAFDQIKLYRNQNLVWDTFIHRMRPVDQKVFKKLIDIVEFSKTNYVKFADFDRKVFYDMSKYFGIINNKGLVGDPWFETMRPELIRIPVKHNLILIRRDVEMTNMLRGNSFATIDYVSNSVIRKFNTFKELHDYLYSLVDFVNRNSKNLGLKQRINSVQKHWRSNQWPMTSTAESREVEKQRIEELKKELVAIERFFKRFKLEDNPDELEVIQDNYNKLLDIRDKIITLQEKLQINDNKIRQLGSRNPEERTVEDNESFFNRLGERVPQLQKSIDDIPRPLSDDEEVARNKTNFTKYEIAVTKFQGKVAIRADVWEHGISYFLTNFNEGPDPWGERLQDWLDGKHGRPDQDDEDEDCDGEYILPGDPEPELPDHSCGVDEREESLFNDILTVRDELTWKRAMAEINVGGNNRRYLVNILESFTLNLKGDNFTFPNVQNLTVELRGNHTITLICCCRVFTLREKQNVVLNNVIFEGERNAHAQQTSPQCNVPFYLVRGTITMRGVAAIKNCLNGAIYNDGGTVNMEGDSSIHHNIARNGGGIYIKAGVLSMRDFSNIACNTATEKGGGVFFVQGSLNVRNNARIFGVDVCAKTNNAKNGAAIFGYTYTSENTVPKLSKPECHCGHCPICNPPVEPIPPEYPDPGKPNPWPDPEHFVKWEMNGGVPQLDTIWITQGERVEEPTGITLEGYELEGWYTNPGLTNKWDFINNTLKKDMTLFAKWVLEEEEIPELKEFEVKFAPNGGIPMPPSRTITEGELVSEPTLMTKGDLIFVGWFKDPWFENFWDFEEDKVTSDLILYAKWENDPNPPTKPKATVSFVTNAQVYYKKEVDVGQTMSYVEITMEGHTFGGWYKDSEFLHKWDFNFDVVEGDMILYAKWDEVIKIEEGTWEYDFTLPGGTFMFNLNDIPAFDKVLTDEHFENHDENVKIYISSSENMTWTDPGIKVPNIWFEEEIQQSDNSVPNALREIGGFEYYGDNLIWFRRGPSNHRAMKIRKEK